jgi:DHA2 family integral membrane protein (MFS transporter)
VAVLGSVFASAYGPRIARVFRPYPVPVAARQAAHQSMAAALAVVGHAPEVARPALRAGAFSAFGSGLTAACLVGAGVAVLGALGAFAFLPGRGGPDTAAPHPEPVAAMDRLPVHEPSPA